MSLASTGDKAAGDAGEGTQGDKDVLCRQAGGNVAGAEDQAAAGMQARMSLASTVKTSAGDLLAMLASCSRCLSRGFSRGILGCLHAGVHLLWMCCASNDLSN